MPVTGRLGFRSLAAAARRYIRPIDIPSTPGAARKARTGGSAQRTCASSADGSRKARWIRIGIAFQNKDLSYNVLLDALPVNGKFGCNVVQTINGQQLACKTVAATDEEALRGALEELRQALGW